MAWASSWRSGAACRPAERRGAPARPRMRLPLRSPVWAPRWPTCARLGRSTVLRDPSSLGTQSTKTCSPGLGDGCAPAWPAWRWRIGSPQPTERPGRRSCGTSMRIASIPPRRSSSGTSPSRLAPCSRSTPPLSGEACARPQPSPAFLGARPSPLPFTIPCAASSGSSLAATFSRATSSPSLPCFSQPGSAQPSSQSDSSAAPVAGGSRPAPEAAPWRR